MGSMAAGALKRIFQKYFVAGNNLTGLRNMLHYASSIFYDAIREMLRFALPSIVDRKEVLALQEQVIKSEV